MVDNGCTIEGCDIFDFMAKHVGLTVIHPGGFEATRRPAESCHLDAGKRVIDIACGKGTSAVYLARTYGCEVVGIDISESLVDEANALKHKKRLDGRVSFRVGDALDLPFEDGEFDVAVSQAMLVLVGHKRRAIDEALRVTKPGGQVGWLELSWHEEPPKEFLDAVSNVLCAYCMLNVHTFEGWEALFREAGITELQTMAFPLRSMGITGMLADEGLVNTSRVLFKNLNDGRIRKRMSTMNRFFDEHTEYFGYGIYSGKKQSELSAS